MPDAISVDIPTLRRIIREEARPDLVPVEVLAGELSVTKRTVRDRCRRYGIPLRSMHGDRWTDEDRGTMQYVSRREWQAREGLDTRTIKR